MCVNYILYIYLHMAITFIKTLNLGPILKHIVLTQLKEAGIESSKKFTPHLTVARLKHMKDLLHFETIMEKLGGTATQEVLVRELVLYESRLFPSGPEYHVLAKYALR